MIRFPLTSKPVKTKDSYGDGRVERKCIACLLIGMICLGSSLIIGSPVLGQTVDKTGESIADRIERATKKINQKQTYQLAYKLKEGEEIRWDFEQIVSTKFQMAGEVEESFSRSENTKLWKVANVDQLGNMTFVFTVESIKMWTKVGDSDPVSYNSETDKEVPEGYVTSADHVGKPLAIFTISPNGTILDRKSNVKGAVFGVGKVTIPLPDQAVPVGHKWSVPIVLSANDERGTKKLKARILYELTKVKDQNAYIRFRTEVLTPVTSEKIRSTIMQKMTKGIVVFDMERGYPVLQRMEWDEKAQGFEGPDSYLKYVARLTEKIISDDDPRNQKTASALAPVKKAVATKPVDIKTRDSKPVMRK